MAAPSGPGRFLVAGGLAAATGSERGGVDGVRIGARLVAGAVGLAAGTGVNVVSSPGVMRREIVGGAETVLETILPLIHLPGVVAQWRPLDGGGPSSGLVVDFHLLPGASGVRYRVGEGGVRAVPQGADEGTTVELCVHPTPASWTAREARGGGLDVTATVDGADPRTPVTCVVAWGSPARVKGAVGALPALGAHMSRATAGPKPGDGLVLRTGVPALDVGWGWAAARVGASLAWSPPAHGADPGAVFWTGMGALAVGDGVTAAAALELLENTEARNAEVGLRAPIPTPAAATLLAARLAMALGDTRAARRHAGALDGDTLERRRRESSQGSWTFWGVALESLADALHHTAPPEALRVLRDAAAAPPGKAGQGGPVRLPTLGAPPPDGSAAAELSALLRVAGSGGTGHAGRAGGRRTGRGHLADARLHPWAALASGDVDAGYAAWRRKLDEGLVGSAADGACRGAWDVPDLLSPGAPGAGIVLATGAHGLLGIAPDAPAGRLGLAPAVPSHLRSFRAEGIAVGDARMDLEYVREGAVHRFTLTPRSGRVPPMVVMEPSVPGSRLLEVRVDGRTASLETSANEGRLRVRAQLPLDGDRSLEMVSG